MSRKTRRAAKLREQAKSRGGEASADRYEKAAPASRASSLTPKRLRFGLIWAEADPEDRLQDVALRAGYSESFATSGGVAELCRDPAIIEVRDRRLTELQQVASVTVEETLIGLRDLARDDTVPARDRVAARRALLAWYARDKGQHAPTASAPAVVVPVPGASAAAPGLSREAKQRFELELLGVQLEGGDEDLPA